MIKISVFILLFILTSCWPISVSLIDKGSMPEEWKTFSVKTLNNKAPNAPLSYSPNLTEQIKDGIQNNTRLQLNTQSNKAEIIIEGSVNNYNLSPIALQEGDNAAKNRLTISTQFTIFIQKPEESIMKLTSTRFADYDSNTDLSSVENQLLDEINEQIVQDVINKLLSNW